MTQRKSFWIASNVALSVFWLAAIIFAATGKSDYWLVPIAAIVLVAHALEVPLALYFLKGRQASPIRVCVMTLLFGYTWWVPARRGIFAVA